MRKGTAVIRTDASPVIGAGHVLRCLALARPLASRFRVVFVIARTLPGLEARIVAAGHSTRVLEVEKAGGPEDLVATLAIAQDVSATLAVVDGTQFDEVYQGQLRSLCGYLVQIDDEAVAVGVADAVVNHGLHAAETLYDGRTRPDAIRLLGPRYALIREEFRKARRSEARRTHLLIVMGGADPAGLTLRVTELLLNEKNLPPIVAVSGSAAPEVQALRARGECSKGRLRVHIDEPRMAEIMAGSMVAIAAAGGTTWELCCLGIPALLVATAPNQIPVAEAAARAGVAVNLGWHADLKGDRLLAELRALLEDPDRQARMASIGKALVDGKGADRVVQAVLGEGTWRK